MTASAGTDLTGEWRKADDAPECANGYPESLAFGTGTYRGARGAGQGFIVWDAGTFRLEGRKLLLSTASDELVSYEIGLSRDVLDVRDPAGCRFTYHRVRPPG